MWDHLNHLTLADITAPAFLQQLVSTWRVPLIALGVALGARFAGRVSGQSALRAEAAPLGVLAGWIALNGLVIGWPEGSHPRMLPVLGLIALGTALLTSYEQRLHGVLPFLIAAFLAWWLIGAPHPDLNSMIRNPTLLALFTGIALFISLARSSGRFAIMAAVASFWGGLAVAGAPVQWQLAALCLMASAVVLPDGGPNNPAHVGLATAAAGAAATADLAIGHLHTGHPGAIDMACLSPLVAMGLASRLGGKLGGFGGSVAAGAVGVAVVWVIHSGLLQQVG